MEWVAIFFSRDLPNPGIKTTSSGWAGRFFTTKPPGKPRDEVITSQIRS